MRAARRAPASPPSDEPMSVWVCRSRSVARAQGAGEPKPDQEPSRQPRAVGAIVPGASEDFFHTGARDDTFQGAETLTSGPGRAGVGHLADVDQRSLLIC